MLERTSFGMQQNSEPLSTNNIVSHAESKPALPKRSPAPKQDTHISTSAMASDTTKNLPEEKSGYATISGSVENPTEMKTTTGIICKQILNDLCFNNAYNKLGKRPSYSNPEIFVFSTCSSEKFNG
jgi:hypothetical protein